MVNLPLLVRENPTVCSADDYHYGDRPKKPENYIWKVENAYKAHLVCRDKVVEAMYGKVDNIVVDNTNIKLKDCKVYLKMAIEHDYEVVIHSIVGCTAEQSYNKNVHKVPYKTCLKMFNTYKPLPSQIEIEGVTYSFSETLHDFRDKKEYFWHR